MAIFSASLGIRLPPSRRRSRRPATNDSWLDELSPGQVIHGERRGVGGDLDEVLVLGFDVGIEPELANLRFDRSDYVADERPLQPGPVGDLVDDGLAVVVQKIGGGAHAALSP